MRNLNFFLMLMCAVIFLSGCAGSTKQPRFVWPPPPQEPRLELVGVYYTEADLHKGAGGDFVHNFLGEVSEGRFSTPMGIVSDGKGRVYISDVHQQNVVVYDFNKKTVDSLSNSAGFKTPLGLATDRSSNIYVADGTLGEVLVFDGNGLPLFSFGKEVFKKPAFLTVNNELERIYVSDVLRHQILVFDMTGKYLFPIATLGKEEGQLFSPQGLAFSPAGNLFVADMFNARIQVFDASGEFKYAFGKRNDSGAGFESPRGLAFDSEGHLYVVEGRRSIIQIFTQEGQYLLSIGDGRQSLSQFGFNAPRSVFIDANDRIFVSEALGRRFAVWQFMSRSYKEKRPFTEKDKQELLEYMEKVRTQK